MSKVTHLTYTGNIRDLIGQGKTIAFVTQHDEAKPGGLFQIDGESGKQSQVGLPCGGLSLLQVGDQFWIGGDDGCLYSCTAKDKTAKPFKTKFSAPIKAMARLADKHVALLTESRVTIVDAKAKTQQTLELDSPGSAIASNPEGTWLVVGTQQGEVSVYHNEGDGQWTLSESEKLHEGQVTSLKFEPEELRFFSAGTDNKFLVTHARGRLEPEDRGRTNRHEKAISAMILAGENRIITGSDDKTCKSWLRGNATKPSTLTDGIVAVAGLAAVTIHKRPNLVVACRDNSLRLFLLEDGRIGNATDRYNDGYTRAQKLFESRESSDRGQAMQELAALDDRKSFEMLAKRVSEDPDNQLRLTAAKLLTKLSHPQLAQQLELYLNHPDAPIRMLVLESLEKLKTEGLIELYQAAIVTNKAEIGTHAISALVKRFRKKGSSVAEQNQILAVFRTALNSETVEIRNVAIFGLEAVFDKKSTRSNLLTLDSKNEDSRRKGLIRLLQRELLDDSGAEAGLRRAVEDRSAQVRQTALLISILSQPKLAEAIRTRDADLDRQLMELESFDFALESKKKTKAKKQSRKKAAAIDLSVADYEPLLVAISSRAVDTCLLGARCLALLEDPRAFGLLMQLSREEDANVRLETCRAFAELGDARAVDRLCSLLADADAQVRDASFSSLEKISADKPLVAAEHGLASGFEDVRRRGLETLVRFAKKSKLRKVDDPAGQLLQQALSDSIASVRMEAFKFVLNSKIGGGQDSTLRFLLTSAHADVRREVLNEVMAEEAQLWSETMMFELLNDPDVGVRGDAFAFLQKKYDKEQTGWLGEAIRSDHVDIRKLACQRLIKIGNTTAQATLALAINDSDSEVRELALQSLVEKGATESLVTALESRYLGVRLAAASALAQAGEASSKPVLLTIASQEYPDTEPEQVLWETTVCQAIDGLSMLGESETVEFLVGLCQNKSETVRHHAAAALKATADVDSLALIKPLLRHEDDSVRMPAAMACALHGDMISARAVLSPDAEGTIDDEDRLMVAAALGDETENQLVQLLDVEDITLANSALILLLCREWLKHDGSPRRIVAALAAKDARIRLVAAKALRAFGVPEELAEVIAEVFNDRAINEDWEISSETIRRLAEVIVFSKPHVQTRAIMLLTHLNESKQGKWDFGWQWFTDRFEESQKAASVAAESQKLPPLNLTQATLDQLAFGAYVGLSREQGGFHYRKYWPRFGWSVEAVRLASVRQLAAMAESSQEFRDPTISVLTHACGGPWATVRELAFATLKELGVEETTRAEIGIASGQYDLAVAGLNLLTRSASAAKRKEVLTDAILNQPRSIGFEAAKMLREDIGSVKACEICMDSSSNGLKQSAIGWLAEDYEDVAAAQKALRKYAMDLPPSEKSVAIGCLVQRKDEQAFEAIANVMRTANPKIPRKHCYRWLLQLRQPGTASFLLDLLDEYRNDLDPNELLKTVGELRDKTVATRGLKLIEQKDLTASAIAVLTKMSGFDQRILDPNDFQAHDRSWMDGQHPRDGDLLAKLMERTIDLGLNNRAKFLVPAARWCLTEEVNLPLERLCGSPDEPTRHAAIEAISFRGEKRDASVEPLKSVIEHRDPMTQFLAAEGLAKAGHDEGLQVLLSAVEMMEDLRFRQRAVLAIGHLADERGLDLLLKLVTHDAHALQDSAAEAIGFLGQSDHREKIFRILKRLVAQEGSVGTRAIVGLRHMDTPEAWNLIRDKAKASGHSLNVAVVIDQLGYDESPETQDLMVEMLERYPNYLQVQMTSARRSFGVDSIVPDIALLKGRAKNQGNLGTLELESLDRVRESASAEQIFELVSKCPNNARSALANRLLMQEQLPVKEAASNLESQYATVVELAARIVGRDGNKKHAKLVGGVLENRLEQYKLESQRVLRQNELASQDYLEDRKALAAVVWAAGRVGGSEKLLLRLVVDNEPDAHFSYLRKAALSGLANGKITSAMQKEIEELLNDHEPVIRIRAANLLLDHTKADPTQVSESLLADRFAFEQLMLDENLKLEPVLRTAAQSAHYQPRALLKIAKSKDLDALIAVAEDASLDLNSRLGAIEGLAKMSAEDSEKALVSLGKSANLEELKKAAWRGLRRSKRAGAKA